ncbi:thermonuclease family protein [Thiomicrospira sp. R3]|uniref:thermonuclease family protein n=1 Tax=Thiomicrospira sp. R3 TaxID=3035472 RepID=UPI00259B3430|nr:thermonuclease family protein [Thiomicrospira sp. R3]WFE68095.1 thermonuclease family protein [Thiomicrospira sp. R3]
MKSKFLLLIVPLLVTSQIVAAQNLPFVGGDVPNRYGPYMAEVDVLEVIRGDLIRVRDEVSTYEFHLMNIITPVYNYPGMCNQAYGKEAKEYLKNKIEGKRLKVHLFPPYHPDGRGIVYLNGVDINMELIEEGLAWPGRSIGVDHYYEIKKAFELFKHRGVRIFSDPDPINPNRFINNEQDRVCVQ